MGFDRDPVAWCQSRKSDSLADLEWNEKCSNIVYYNRQPGVYHRHAVAVHSATAWVIIIHQNFVVSFTIALWKVTVIHLFRIELSSYHQSSNSMRSLNQYVLQ